MTPHNSAKKGDIAPTVLMPGDPLRAKHIAETYFENPVCFNEVRGMLGYTGTYKGVRLSVMGHGMGMPSVAIYATELMRFYEVKTLIRVGSCGGFPPLRLRDIVIAMSASTDSAMFDATFKGAHYAPTADFALLRRAVAAAEAKGIQPHVGPVFCSDTFYHTEPDIPMALQAHGCLAAEMESAALYTLAARHGCRALAMMTVSDLVEGNQVGEETTPEERQRTFGDMMEIALETAISV
ncbi:MAG: purine-nucleoside phosphorylase [Clostridiales bacterium]|nr:purine-nucleoside phosphorylase [Clostridiales bacterium]